MLDRQRRVGAARRGRGVPRRRRPRQSLVPRPHAAQRVDVRRARHAVRVLQLRQPLVHERGVRTGRARAARCCCAPRRRSTGLDVMRDAGASRRSATATSPPAPAGSARRSRPTARSTARPSCAARCASSTTEPRRPRTPASPPRIGLAAGQRRGVALPLLRPRRREHQPPTPLTPNPPTVGGKFRTRRDFPTNAGRLYGKRLRIQSATISIASGRWPSR